jgi:lysyl-tRNA synthetase class 2
VGGGGDISEAEARIAKKGDEIRALKAGGTGKSDLAPHVEELKGLKAKLADMMVSGGIATATAAATATDSATTATKTTAAAAAAAATTGGTKKKKKDDDAVEMSVNELRDSRLAKVASMRDAGIEPYAYSYDPTASASRLASDYEGKLGPGEEDSESEYAVAGRVMVKRVFGRLAFYALQDETGTIQLQFDRARLGEFDPESFANLKAWTDAGDIIGARGTIRRTEKGELTLYAREWTMLTKSALPLPDKYHGLTDVSKRYRSRHLDLIVNPAVRDTFRKRAKITSCLRRQLDAKGFLEIETPVLTAQPGGAEAKPFETYHNTMDMALTLRIATELHLKRLVIGGFPRVYELGRIFRNEGISTRHNPEFTSVELYQAYADYNDMIELTEELVCGESRLSFTFCFVRCGRWSLRVPCRYSPHAHA